MPKVFRQTAILVFVATILLAFAACGHNVSGQACKDIAATVNGKDICLSDVDRLITQQTQGQQLSPTQLAAARLQALDNLIQREAVVLRAEKEKTVPTEDDITTTIKNQKSQMTDTEWQKFLKDNNLTEEQLRALEKAKEEKAAHGEIETEHPGYLGAQDTFYVGTLKGVGRIYQQTFIDTYSRVASAKLYDRKNALVAAVIVM